MATLELSRKQKIALDLLDDSQVVELYFGGAAGGGKTMLVCLWILKELIQYPGIRIGLGRKEITRLKQTTLVTLLSKAHPIMNVLADDFTYQDQKGLITYRNGSAIQLLDLARQPSDPDFDTFGSLELTHCVIEEAGEVVQKAKNVFSSRKNRHLNKEYGIVGKTVLTGNPSQNFTYQEYYEPYKALGMGDSQKWEFGEVEIESKKLPAYRAFVKSLPTDNPKVDHNYIEVLKGLPPQERKRLYEGNWDYLDTDDMLFASQLLDRSLTTELRSGKKFIGVDVADKGKDKTIVTLIDDGILKEQRRLQVNTTGERAISEAYALELIKYAQQNGFDSSLARNIAIESNGVGVGMRDFMRSNGWGITEYTATSSSRSKGFYDFSQDLDKGRLQINSQLETINELRKQLMTITYEFKENLEPKILEKKKIKEVLGYSPDEADSAMIANWIANKKTVTSKLIF